MFSFGSRERTLKMVWRIERKEKTSFLVGTAHFFPWSFKTSLVRLMQHIDDVLFEGPLDEQNMDTVREKGTDHSDTPSLYESLDSHTIQILNRELSHYPSRADSSFMSYMDIFHQHSVDIVRLEIEGLRPWMAFFKIWSYYLRKRGWVHSVDLEAHEIARKMNKMIYYLETIDEQIDALNGISLERIVNFFKKVDQWEKFAKRHAKNYLKGAYDNMIKSTIDFPSRCPSIIDMRDPILFERMEPFVEKGRAGIFVGTIHIAGIKKMLENRGYSVLQKGI